MAQSGAFSHGDVVALAPTADGEVVVLWTGGVVQRLDGALGEVTEAVVAEAASGCCAQHAHVDASGRVFLSLQAPSEVIDGHGEREMAPVVMKFDLATMNSAVVHAFDVPPVNGGITSGPAGLILAFGSEVLLVDPETGSARARFELDEPASSVSVSRNQLMVVTPRRIRVLDAATLEPVHESIEPNYAYGVMAGALAWIHRGGKMVSLDPATGRSEHEIHEPVRSFTGTDDYLWWVIGSSVVVLDGSNGNELARAPVGEGWSFGAIAARGASLWLERPGDGTIIRFELE